MIARITAYAVNLANKVGIDPNREDFEEVLQSIMGFIRKEQPFGEYLTDRLLIEVLPGSGETQIDVATPYARLSDEELEEVSNAAMKALDHELFIWTVALDFCVAMPCCCVVKGMKKVSIEWLAAKAGITLNAESLAGYVRHNHPAVLITYGAGDEVSQEDSELLLGIEEAIQQWLDGTW